MRFVLGKGDDPRVRVLLREALSVLVDQQPAQQDRRCGGRLHAREAYRAGRGGRHRVDPRRADRRLQPRRADQASRRRAPPDPSRPGGPQRIAAPVRQLARHLEHDCPHGLHAAALFDVAAGRHAARHDDHLPGAARRVARLRRARLAGVARVGVDVHRLRADAALLPAFAVVGAGAAARRAVLRRRDLRVGLALLARQGRPVEGPRAGAGAGPLSARRERGGGSPPRAHRCVSIMYI
ncbi:putative Gamma-glutamyltranspeptidase @ Glutathione hydrolase [Burkholderia multivorans]